MPHTFDLKIATDSDWHVGSGFGRPGDMDRLVLRDGDGLPFIPGKTVTGIWRDACELLVAGLDDGQTGIWHGWLRYLFGDQPSRESASEGANQPKAALMTLGEPPYPAAISIRAATIDANIAAHLRGTSRNARQLRDALFVVKPGVQIDDRSGRARDEHLRFEEMVRGGIELSAQVTLNSPLEGDQFETARAILALSAAVVERLGAKRRRGSGKCRWSLDGINAGDSLRWLETARGIRAPITDAPTLRHAESHDRHAGVRDSTGQIATIANANVNQRWHELELRLTLHDPVCVPAATLGNTIESLNFIPGTYLLGHVTTVLEALKIDARQAIAAGRLRVSTFMPEIQEKRAVPVPLAWFQRKGSQSFRTTDLRNRLLQVELWGEDQFKQIRGGYLVLENGQVIGQALVAMDVLTHNTIEEDSQRPTSEVGGVYSYEAIAATQIHRGVLRVDESIWTVLATKQDQFRGTVVLGRSKKDDYGRATLEVLPTGAAGNPMDPLARVSNGEFLDVFLLSDAILHDESLRMSGTLDNLLRELNFRINEGRAATDGIELQVVRSFVRSRRFDSWHVGWQLPRATLVTMQAGSCVRFQLKRGDDKLERRLSEIEQSGVGLRRGEGYGEVAFDHPLLSNHPRVEIRAHRPPAANPLLMVRPDDRSYSTACRIENSLWRKNIAKMALAKARELVQLLKWDRKPTSAQLGNLRSMARELTDWNSRSVAQDWLKHLRETKNRADKWPTGSLEALGRLLDLDSESTDAKSARIWTHLLPEHDWPCVTANGQERLKSELWPEAVRAILDACIRYQQRKLNRYSSASARG